MSTLDLLILFFCISFSPGLPSSIKESLFRLWISEFPSIPNSTTESRSAAMFVYESLKELRQTLDTLSKPTTRLYIEIHSNSTEDFIKHLNTTQIYLERIVWMPCIVIFYPNDVETSLAAEETVLQTVSNLQTSHFSLTSEVYVAFNVRGDERSFDKILCDLFDYKRNITESRKFCYKFYFDEPLYASEDFFGYNPVLRRRRDLQGAILNVIGQYDSSYEERLSLHEYENGTVEFTSGMCLDMLLALKVSMNFSYVPKKGNGWVGILPNGSWTGMSGQLIYGEADLSIAQASFVMMIDQLHGISFLQASAHGQFVAIFRQPRSSVNLLTSIMPRKGWILALFTWGIVLISVYIATALIKRYGIISTWDIDFIQEVVLWALTTACQKGHYIRPTSLGLRAICIVASFLAICIYVACSAKLTGNLATQEVPIKNFQDLASSKLDVYTDKWLPVARSLIEKIYDQRGVQIPLQNSKLYTIDDGLPKIILEKTPMAFVSFADAVASVYYRLNKSDNFFCDVVSTVKVAAAKTPAGMFVKKGSPLKEILNYNILMLAESGILRRLNIRYDDKTQIKCQSKGNFYRGGLFLKDLQTPFQILFGGLAVTLALCVCEKLISIKRRYEL